MAGWRALPFVLLGASVAGLTIAVLNAIRGRPINAATPLPLGTFLAIAAWCAWLAGAAVPGLALW
jgi:leader peptidase (prepilin peptidase) / N-methyltransferase